jgi:hypothetical protein
LYTGWDAHCPGLVAARERESKWKSKAERWETAPTSGDAGWDIPEDDPHCQEWLGSSAKLVTTLHAVSCGWPSVEGGVEVSIEVRSDLSDSEERPTCRSLVSIGCLSVSDLLSFLCYSAVGTSGRSYASSRSHC